MAPLLPQNPLFSPLQHADLTNIRLFSRNKEELRLADPLGFEPRTFGFLQLLRVRRPTRFMAYGYPCCATDPFSGNKRKGFGGYILFYENGWAVGFGELCPLFGVVAFGIFFVVNVDFCV